MSCLALQIKKASKSTRQQEAGDNSNSSICLVARQLHRWQGLAFGRILSDVDSSMLFMGDVAATIGLFLSSGLSIRFPSCTPDERYPLEVQDQLLSLATHWLYHCRTQAPADLVSHVIYQLQCSTPRPLTFRGLLRLIAGHMRILLLGDVDEFHERLSRHADLLCSMGLLHLEASLWGCSLRCTESPDKEPLFSEWAAQGIIGKYRRRLIDLVDDAEKRCFGQASGSTPRLGHNIDFAGVETDDEGESIRSKSAGIQWQWEAMIGGWVQVPKATPSIKRPRKVTRQRPAEGDSGDVFDDDSLLKYRQRRKQSLRTSPDKGVGSARVLCIDSSPCASQERNIMASPDELYLGPSIASRLSLYGPQHRTRPTARHSEPMPRTSFDTDIFASPTPLPRSVKLSPYRRPRLSNFTTLLSDAILSRTILHTKRRLVDDTPISTPPRKRPRVAMISQSRARNSRTEIIKTPFDQSPSPLESPEPDEFQAQVIDLDIEIPSCYTPTPVKGYSSDDPLDLFMVDTSPVS
ncbi:hypothetical protein AX16_001873 [Volvariella volvacea WC 439]|nr:hypothetical protein AX16_001873 [Volvariella volvacea WC 439]